MRKIGLMLFVVLLVLSETSYGGGKELLKRARTFKVASDLLNGGDIDGAVIKNHIKEDVPAVLAWKLARNGEKPDCILAILPSGGDYADNDHFETQCASLFGEMRCRSSDGSTADVFCDRFGCDSFSQGPTTRYRLVVIDGRPPRGSGAILWQSTSVPFSAWESSWQWLRDLCRAAGGRKNQCKQKAKAATNLP